MIKHRRIPADIFDLLERLVSLLQQDQRYLFGGLASGVQKPLSDVDEGLRLEITREIKSHGTA